MDSFREGLRPGRTGRSGRGLRSDRLAVAAALLLCASAALAQSEWTTGPSPVTPSTVESAAIQPAIGETTSETTAGKETIDLRAAIGPFARQVVYDAKDIATAPVQRWGRHEWTRFGEGTAIVLGAYVFDEQLSKFFARQHNSALDHYLSAVTHLGGGYGVDLTVLLAVGGYFTGDQRMFDAGVDSFQSSIFAAGVVTPVIKSVVGRARPNKEEGKHSFHPFDANYESFPSGHTTNAFAIFGAIASRYSDSRWVPAVSYTLATSVAIARVHDRAHWASDVLAGGMIGHAIARSIVANHQRMHIAVIPTSRGVIADVRF